MSLRAILGGSRVKKKSPVKKTTASTATTASTKANAKATGSKSKNSSGSGRGSTASFTGNDGAFDDASDDVFGSTDGDVQDFDDDNDDYKLDDSGLVASLADDLTLRDVVQALRYSRGNMFDPIPGLSTSSRDEDDEYGEYDQDGNVRPRQPPKSMRFAGGNRHKGYVGNSTRIADILNTRRRMPALATTAHIASLLPNATATERETVALVRAGVIRKVVQPQWRRGVAASAAAGGGGGDSGSPSKSSKSSSGGDARYRKALAIGNESLGEVLVETAELQRLVQASSLGAETKSAFSGWLGGGGGVSAPSVDNGNIHGNAHGNKYTINSHPAPQLTVGMVDELVRGGFLVGHGASAGLVGSLSVAGHRSERLFSGRGSQSDTGDVYARPEDRTTLLSLETVAKAASGSFDAVGGVGAVYTAGGGGARAALPGRANKYTHTGVSTSVEDVMLAVPGHGMFVKIVSGALAYLVGILARTTYHETLESSLRERWDAGGNITKGGGGSRGVKRVPLSRTRKWKDFYGMSFDWVLAEAVGAGLVELFDTGSVGRGVRLLG